MQWNTTTTGALLTAVSALGFSTLPVFGVAAYRGGGNVVTVLGVRFALAALALWAYVLLTRQQLPDRRTGLHLLLMGAIGYTTMSMLYMTSVAGNRLSPALAALLLYTYPALVAVEVWWFDRQPLTGRQSLALALTLLGVALVLLAQGAGTTFTWAGAGFALGASVVYGTYILFGSRVTRRTSPVVATTFVATAAALMFLGYGAITRTLVPVTGAGWLAIVGTAVFATVLAVLLFFAGLERLGPARASIISTLEPVGTAALSALFLGDRLGPAQLAGGVLVLAGVVWLQLGKDR